MSRKIIILYRLKYLSVWKMSTVGLLLVLVPLTIFLSILAFFGINTIMWDGRFLYGVEALYTGLPLGLALDFLIILFLSPFLSLNLWIYLLFFPMKIIYSES